VNNSIRSFVTAALCAMAFGPVSAWGETPKSPREAAVAVLAHSKEIYQKVCEASPAPGATVLPAAVEVRLGRALIITSDVLTKGDDRELATALVEYVAVSGCSSNRAPALAMARIFRARPDSIQASIEAVPAAQRCNVVGQLDWGWKNDFLPAPTAAGVATDRDARLKKLKTGLPAKCT
jgi:hypothetical protein